MKVNAASMGSSSPWAGDLVYKKFAKHEPGEPDGEMGEWCSSWFLPLGSFLKFLTALDRMQPGSVSLPVTISFRSVYSQQQKSNEDRDSA